MATYYWVGGSGNWTSDDPSHWSLSSGGTGFAGVPTIDDNVIFDLAGTITVTIIGTVNCNNFSVAGSTYIFVGSVGEINVGGSLDLLTGTLWNFTGGLWFINTQYGRWIWTNGVVINSPIYINSPVDIGYLNYYAIKLGSALLTTKNIYILAGKLITGDADTYYFNLTATASDIYVAANAAFDFSYVTVVCNNFTCEATSYINASGSLLSANQSSSIVTAPCQLLGTVRFATSGSGLLKTGSQYGISIDYNTTTFGDPSHNVALTNPSDIQYVGYFDSIANGVVPIDGTYIPSGTKIIHVSYSSTLSTYILYLSNAVTTASVITNSPAAITQAVLLEELNVPTPLTNGITTVSLEGYVGTLTINANGSQTNRRTFIKSNTLFKQVTLWSYGFSSAPQNIDFRDINLDGAAAGTTITNGGNCQGNNGIDFPSGKTVYMKASTTTVLWSDTVWATSSGGTPALANFPLAQDEAIIDNNSYIYGLTVNFTKTWNIGILKLTKYSQPLNINISISINIYRHFYSNMSVNFGNYGAPIYFINNDIYWNNINANGAVLNNPVQFLSYTTGGGEIDFNSAFICTKDISFIGATYIAGYDVVTPTYFTYTITAPNITFNNNCSNGQNHYIDNLQFVCTGSNFNILNRPNYFSGGNCEVRFTSSSTKTFNSVDAIYATSSAIGTGLALCNAGSGALIVDGNYTFQDIYNLTSPTTFEFGSSKTIKIYNFNIQGTDGNYVFLTNTNIDNFVLQNLQSTSINTYYLQILKSSATGGLGWNASNSIDLGGNYGWTFGYGQKGNFLMFF